MATKHLDGKVAVVTGGAGGMGSWIAKTYAEQGAKVVVADTGADVEGRMGMDPARVNAVVDDIKAAGGEAVGVIGDIADMDTAENTIRLALDTYGGLDILCCAHGILRERMIFNMTEDEWDGLVRAHLKGCFAPTKFASIYWRQERTRGGRIIYFTSDAGVFGSAGQPNYSAAHNGKLGLMRSNARALDRYGVTCNAIAPRAWTRLTATIPGSNRPGAQAPDPARIQQLDPDMIAPMVCYLAMDEAWNINSQVFLVYAGTIAVLQHPTPWRTIFKHGMWTLDELSAQVPAILEGTRNPAPPPPELEVPGRNGQQAEAAMPAGT